MTDDATCTHARSCEMYKLLKLSGSLKTWQSRYCNSASHKECARYQLSLAGRPVPINLMPNGALLNVPASGNEKS
jgi:hypothetical protein